MNHTSPQSQENHSKSAAAAMIAWLGGQLMAIVLCSEHFMFWSRSPRAVEQFALIAMVATQIAIASLLFPLLLHTMRSTAIVFCSAWVMSQLASILADAETSRWGLGEFYVSAWLAALYLWTRIAKTDQAKLFSTAIAGMLTLGGPLLWYLHADFASTNDGNSTLPFSLFGPLSGAISQIISGPAIAPWIWPALIFASSAMIFMLRKDSHLCSRQVIN
jgi:hypothetical protein